MTSEPDGAEEADAALTDAFRRIPTKRADHGFGRASSFVPLG